MTDRIVHEQHRSRSRDRTDQRRPTFQVLNVIQPKAHSHGKRDFSHYGISNHMDTERDIKVAIGSSPLNSPPHLQKTLVGVHAVGKPSSESVTSRGPACNFTNFHGGGGTSNNRSYGVLPGKTERHGRPRSASPPDRLVIDEPSDLIVWNPSKKTSRSNILCPLTESEFRNIDLLDKVRKGPRGRSNSLPNEHTEKKFMTGTVPSRIGLNAYHHDVVYKVDNICKEAVELLDDFVPPPMSPGQVSPSPSITSTTYSVQISLVTQQLDEIRQVQDDVLKHLGEEITKMTEENERLKRDMEHMRGQNQGLLTLANDRADELVRMKQIFRSRNLINPQSDNIKSAKHEEQDVSPEGVHQVQQTNKRNNKPQHHKGNRDSAHSNGSTKSPTHKKLSQGDGDPSGEEEHTFLKTSADISSKPSPPKSKRSDKNKSLNSPHNTLVNPHDRQTDHGGEDSHFVDIDESASYISNDSNLKVSSRERRHSDPHRHHHHHSSRHHTNSPELSRHRSRSRSKSKSPRNSNCYDHDDKILRHPHHHPTEKSYPRGEDDNEDLEMRPSGGGCLRIFSCCWSSSNSRSRTDSVDDVVLRQGCPG